MTFFQKLWYKWTGREEIGRLRVGCANLERQVAYLKERDRMPTEADFQAAQWKKFLQNRLGKADSLDRSRVQRAFHSCSAIPPPSEKVILETVWPVVAALPGFEFESLLMGVRLLGLKEEERKKKMAIHNMELRHWPAEDREVLVKWASEDRRDFGPREEF